jgi:hypothetical protein
MSKAGKMALLTVAAMAMQGAPASAATPNTFEGSCALSGTFFFDPPLGTEIIETRLVDRAAGTCTGSLNGVYRENAPVLIKASGTGTLSCFAGEARTSGALIFTWGTKREGDDTKIRFSTEGTTAALQAVVHFRGAVSGEGLAYATFLPYADQSGFDACQAGELGSARYDVYPQTLTPVVG